MAVEPWVIELNNHISVFDTPESEVGYDEFVPYLIAKQMIAEREEKIVELNKLLEPLMQLYQLKNLDEIFKLYTQVMSNPCANGHVFWYSSSSTSMEPPEGAVCRCGLVRYHSRKYDLV